MNQLIIIANIKLTHARIVVSATIARLRDYQISGERSIGKPVPLKN